MRFLVLVLMIVLLPLRGWAGDAMATQMAGAAVAIEKRASSALEIRATAFLDYKNEAYETSQAMPDCHEQSSTHSETDQAANNDHCGTCQACQACHTVALLPSALEVTVSFTSPQLRLPHAAAFTSAATALCQKPPIS